MMFEAEALDFPAFAHLPKRDKSRIERVWDSFQELSRVSEQKGMLIPQVYAARVLDVSPQRVTELIRRGILETYNVHDVPFVTGNSVVAYAKSERKAGRPPKTLTQKKVFVKAVLGVGGQK